MDRFATVTVLAAPHLEPALRPVPPTVGTRGTCRWCGREIEYIRLPGRPARWEHMVDFYMAHGAEPKS